MSAGEPPRRLIGWERVDLAPGETKPVHLTIDPEYLSIFNVDRDGWDLVPGDYTVFVGESSRDTPLSATVRLGG